MSDEMEATSETPAEPRFGIGSIVNHVKFGRGRVLGYEGETYIVTFKGGDTALVAFSFEGMKEEERHGDPELDRVRQAVREVLGDFGWLEADLEMGARWKGGIVKLIPGRDGTQEKEIPVEQFFSKIIGIREKLRVLEQKINNHKSLAEAEKLELEGYITRCYGSLTTFNALFADKKSHFVGQKKG